MSGIGSNNGWLEAAIAWEVCASLHRQYCKGKDALFTTRQSDFVKHAENARRLASRGQAPAAPAQAAPVDAAVQRDAERLDFMIESCTQVATISPSGRKYLCYPDGRMQAGSYPTARAAIDAARAAQKGGAA